MVGTRPRVWSVLRRARQAECISVGVRQMIMGEVRGPRC